ncbi:GNAT family N-acetyltransferase [Photobacterium galatheae]|uniref:GNAT family acetyltransferase n=1 Tax=Photobacterium galatheae TaxID=1654360 RepID=A0A066RWQ3_9GAMM|nr:GNAT family N-acetyltransferase [Photobacterium galatheae]KDM93536.1 GNAT family acetyltransferase [Photobacterium galatheae]MCM0151360.1 GNAT family N-acetyltransferase [Photobacterium galatheae]
MQDYAISTDQSRLDFRVIHGFLANSYWAKNIPETVMKKAIEHSLCFGIYHVTGEQVGFARLITDKATFAYLADVFISDAHRGKGLSKKLMDDIVRHPDLQGLRRMVLATRDAHGLYAQYGFRPIQHPDSFMEIWQPNVYQTAGQASM